jgi:L-seryl-tRNA(Ser) seleniumtransferase
MADLQNKTEALNLLFRAIPSVNDLLLLPAWQRLLETHPRPAVLDATRSALAGLRLEIASGQHEEAELRQSLQQLPEAVADLLHSRTLYSLRPVINATGVLLHTNLGRAPLSEAALNHVLEIGQDYCNLELDLETGSRSRRDAHAETLVLRVLVDAVTGHADVTEKRGVIIVNNCAVATFLALNSLADKGEVIASRGELVEIGGGFRIPEIMEKSGAVLKEVGTTNRTRLADYEAAISPATALLLRVHQSNFSIEGFAERPSLQDLVALSKRTATPLFEDQGTGLLASLERFGITGEPTLRESFDLGVDLIAASGDKLLGGPQCGILVGREHLIVRIRKNPLLRAFRVDKLTYAALEATLLQHFAGDLASIPVERMLSVRPEELMRRCRDIAGQITSTNLNCDVVPVDSLIGGGTAPRATLASCAISLRHMFLASTELLAALRKFDPPIVGRIADDTVLLDLRTVPPRFDVDLVVLLNSL